VSTPAAQFRIEPLSGAHDRARFVSGSAPLDRYLREQVSQDIKRRIVACCVAVDVAKQDVVGFYTLTATSIALDALALDLIKKLPRSLVPAALLGRLAIAASCQGKGLAAALLADAFLRVSRVEMGVFAMLVDAKDESAQRFYEKFGFTLLAGEQRRLILPIATALSSDGREGREMTTGRLPSICPLG
jgi:GNAT superfamily N-acetyltransferase